MKVLALVLLVGALSSCSTVSDYNQGCRDGLEKTGAGNHGAEKYCNDLEQERKDKKKLDHRTI